MNRSLDALLAYRNDEPLCLSDRVKVLEIACAAAVGIIGDEYPEDFGEVFTSNQLNDCAFIVKPFTNEDISEVLKYALFDSKPKPKRG